MRSSINVFTTLLPHSATPVLEYMAFRTWLHVNVDDYRYKKDRTVIHHEKGNYFTWYYSNSENDEVTVLTSESIYHRYKTINPVDLHNKISRELFYDPFLSKTYVPVQGEVVYLNDSFKEQLESLVSKAILPYGRVLEHCNHVAIIDEAGEYAGYVQYMPDDIRPLSMYELSFIYEKTESIATGSFFTCALYECIAPMLSRYHTARRYGDPSETFPYAARPEAIAAGCKSHADIEAFDKKMEAKKAAAEVKRAERKTVTMLSRVAKVAEDHVYTVNASMLQQIRDAIASPEVTDHTRAMQQFVRSLIDHNTPS